MRRRSKELGALESLTGASSKSFKQLYSSAALGNDDYGDDVWFGDKNIDDGDYDNDDVDNGDDDDDEFKTGDTRIIYNTQTAVLQLCCDRCICLINPQ